MKTYLAADIGGTNVKCGLVADSGEMLERSRFSFHSEKGPKALIDDLVSHFKQLAEKSNRAPAGAVIAAAGVIAPAKGLLITSPNLPGWNNVPVVELVEESLEIDTKLENDANLYALGEWLAGAGRGMNNMIGITLGTGVGGGIILNGRLWNGVFATAGEIGHTTVEPQGIRCNCGSIGCLETISSATGVTRMARERLSRGYKSSYTGKPEDITAEILYNMALKNDLLALEVFARAGWALGIAIANVFNLLGLEGAVIGAGMSPAFDMMYPSIMEQIRLRAFSFFPEDIVIKKAELGNDAALIGAPALFKPL